MATKQLDISFSVEGEKEVAVRFDSMGARTKSLRKPFRKIADYFLEEIDSNFSGRGSTWGKWKRRIKSPADGHPLLEDTGRMRGSFTGNATNSYAEIGNTDRKFKYHQSKRPRKTRLARRVMMAVEEEQRRESVKIIQKHIMEG